MPQVPDLKGWDNALAKIYDVRFIPANFLIVSLRRYCCTVLKGEELNKNWKNFTPKNEAVSYKQISK